MAGIKQIFSLQIKDDAGRAAASSEAVITGDAQEEFSVVSPHGSDVTLPLTVDVSTVAAFWVVSDKDVHMTENAADLEVDLLAGVPYWWYTGKGTNPFSVDIVSLKFANAGTADATVKGAFLTT